MTFTPLYRTMALWLCTAAIIISSALATATYFFEMERIDDAIVDLAVGEARTFRAMHGGVFHLRDDEPVNVTESAIEEQLRHFMATRSANAEGHFIVAELYDTARKPLGEATQDMGSDIEAALSAKAHQFPTDAPWYDKLKVNGQLFIRAVVLLHDPVDHHPLGYFEGVYHVSATRLASIRDRLITNVLLVVGVVLCTTVFLVPVVLGVSRDLLALSRGLLRANIETLEVLGNAIAKRDSDTGAHNYRVTIFAVRLAEAIGMAHAPIRQLIKGAFLHDVGKIGITDSILLKPGRLTPDEFNEMKNHVAHGQDIVTRASWLHDAAEVVRFHHEKFDGSGYLQGLRGTAIPQSARIFAIADVFDALISRRPYKEPLPFEEALSIIENGANSHFDPVLVAAFSRIARPLYDTFFGQDDAVVEASLQEITDRYFRVTKG